MRTAELCKLCFGCVFYLLCTYLYNRVRKLNANSTRSHTGSKEGDLGSHNSEMPDDDSSISGNFENDDYDSIDGDANSIADVTAITNAQSLVSGNPLKLFERQSNGKLKGAVDQTPRTLVEEYLQALFALPNCFAKYYNKFTPCCCLNEQQENVCYIILADRLSKFFCFFFNLMFTFVLVLSFVVVVSFL